MNIENPNTNTFTRDANTHVRAHRPLDASVKRTIDQATKQLVAVGKQMPRSAWLAVCRAQGEVIRNQLSDHPETSRESLARLREYLPWADWVELCTAAGLDPNNPL